MIYISLLINNNNFIIKYIVLLKKLITVNIIAAFNVGSCYQNVAFYTFILLLIYINRVLLKRRTKPASLNQHFKYRGNSTGVFNSTR